MVDKFVGDAAHVLFNAPFDLPDHCARAVQAGQALQTYGVAFAADPQNQGLGITRVGMECGVLVVGDVGAGEKLDYTAHGRAMNTNADDIALAVATAMSAAKLMFCSSVPGVMTDPKDPSTLFSSLTVSKVRALIAEGIIKGGMIPKVESCIGALQAGVAKIHIVGADQPHALLLEIFTQEGIGTELTLD